VSTFTPVEASFTISYVLISIALNVWALITILLWLKRPERRHQLSEKTAEERLELGRDLQSDRYRLYATIFFLGIPIVAASNSLAALVVWVGMVGGVIFICFDADFRARIQRQKAGVYATLLTLYMGTGIFIILGTAMYGYPELRTFLIPAGILFIILLITYWLAIFRIKRRWKWN
jgi:hypothetical protein